jgi:HAD superfamily hydrolase (TIGR01509 family)
VKLKAVLFDVDGTIAETEEVHRIAFNRAFEIAGREWYWSEDDYRALLKTTGGRERIRRFVDGIGAKVSNDEIVAMHHTKNRLYGELIEKGAAIIRPGIARLIAEANSIGIQMAIATTTSRANIESLFNQHFDKNWPKWFDVIIAGEDVALKKPDPEVYRLALEALGLEAEVSIAIEDSHNGLVAASALGIAVVVTPSCYTSHEQFDGAAITCASLDDPVPVDISMLDGILLRLPMLASSK